MAVEREEQLYGPVKAFLEGQGYAVKGEVRGCDLVARRGDEPPVIVELKRAFTLELLLQGVDRLALSERVYVAVPARSRWSARRRNRGAALKLCRRLGLGLLEVGPEPGRVKPLLDPVPYRPRPSRKRQDLLLREFERRIGDANTGGQSRRPIVTAYRQNALRCAVVLDHEGPTRAGRVAAATGFAAGVLLRQDVYGWFRRVERGVYDLTPEGRDALVRYAGVVMELEDADAAATTERAAGGS